jgi:hypothetical protein
MDDISTLIGRVDALARGDVILRAKLEVIAAMFVRLVEGCDSVSIGMVVDGRATTAAISDRLALEVDLMQYRVGEGPCLDALTGQVVRLDLVEGSTYDRFAPGALDAGVLDIVSIPCLAGGRVVGTANLYSRTPHGLDGAESAVAPLVELLSDVLSSSALLDAAVELADQATATLEEQGLVNQAVGLVAHRRGCSMEAALAFIVEAAVGRGQSLRAAAEAILGGHADAIQDQ